MDILQGFSFGFLGNITLMSLDVMCLLGLLVLTVILGLSKGKKMILQFLVALYPAALVAVFFPYYNDPSFGTFLGGSSQAGPLLVFVVSLVLFTLLFHPFIDSRYQSQTFWRFFEVILLSVVTIGLLLAILYHVVDIEVYYDCSELIDLAFISPGAFLLWLLAPLAGIPLFMKMR